MFHSKVGKKKGDELIDKVHVALPEFAGSVYTYYKAPLYDTTVCILIPNTHLQSNILANLFIKRSDDNAIIFRYGSPAHDVIGC